MAEDFTTYTEADPNGRLSQTSSRATFTGLTANETAYLTKDKGAAFFTGHLQFDFEFQITSSSGGSVPTCIFCIADTLRTLDGFVSNGESAYLATVWIDAGDGNTVKVELDEIDSGSRAFANFAGMVKNTLYYARVIRDPAVGTFGTLYIYVYSDSGRTTLVGSTSLTLSTSVKNFRYMYGCASRNFADTHTNTGFVQNLTISISNILTMVATVASFALTGNAVNLTSARKITAAVASFTLTGVAALFSVGHTLVATVGTFTLSFIDAIITSARNITAAVGSYTMTGIDIAITMTHTLIAEVAAFIVNGIAPMLKHWDNRSKPTDSGWTDKIKPSIGVGALKTKPSNSGWTNKSK